MSGAIEEAPAGAACRDEPMAGFIGALSPAAAPEGRPAVGLGVSSPGIAAASARPGGNSRRLAMTALAVPGHPDGEVDTRPRPSQVARQE